jgi:hemerythrin-like domain-containing protein
MRRVLRPATLGADTSRARTYNFRAQGFTASVPYEALKLGTAGDLITPLVEEHQGIADQLKLLRGLANASRPPSRRRLRNLLICLELQLRRHFDDEEQNLYRPLNVKLKSGSPTSEMTREHRSLSRSLDLLLRAFSDYETDRGKLGEFRLRINLLQSEMDAHVEKEEKVLFWLADLKL